MDYTFVPQYNGESTKRRRLAKACEACRARKKRCYHNPIEDDHDKSSGNEDTTTNSNGAGASGNHSTRTNGLYRGISAQKGKANRFLSDLSPETRLLERTIADGECTNAKSMDSVGMWVNKNEYETLVKQRNAAYEAAGLSAEQSDSTTSTTPARLQASQLAGLVDVYFARIHPFLPMIDEAEFRQAYAGGRIPEPYLHAICLIAMKDKTAEELFEPSEPGSPVSPRLLCRGLYLSVKAAISTPSKFDKLTLIRVLTLLSLHTEGSDGSEETSLHVMQAMHYCQTLGLHLSASFPDKDGKITKRIFWCVWISDRLSSIMNGRPILMADNDMAIEAFEPGESGFPAFEILLKIVHVMNDIIAFYRPGNTPAVTGWETNYPGFDEIVDSVQGWSLSPSIVATLQIAYLAGSVLSHRAKGVAEFATTTPSFVRQSLATIQIIRLMSPPRLETLHPLPLIPYAVSLALSVSYQHMRQDQLRYQQEDAKADFESCLVILQQLRRTWSSTDAICVLSEKVIGELSRVSDMASFRIRRSNKGDKQLEGLTSACRHEGEKVEFARSTANQGVQPDNNGLYQTYTPATDHDGLQKDSGLFEGIDDIFGTYLDPNYPVNLDFLDDLEGVAGQGQWLAGDATTLNTA